MRERIGLIGCGIMGTAMAERLRAAGMEVLAFDIDADARDRAAAAGCEIAGSASAVGKVAAVTLISLPRPEHVSAAVQGAEGLLTTATRGSVIADTSTVDPTTSRANAAAAAALGVGYLDAPVLGRPGAVGAWTMPVGGKAADLHTAEPVLRALASRIVHVGPSGHGNTVKLLNNLMFGAINAATAETFALAERLGVDQRMLFETIVDSGAGTVSNLFRHLGPRMVERDYEPTFSVDNLEKDIALGLAMAQAAGMRLEVAEAEQRINQRAQAAGHGRDDSAAVVEVMRRPAEGDAR